MFTRVHFFFSLRQHYLDQVLRVDNKPVVLSAELTQLPYAPYSKGTHSSYLSLTYNLRLSIATRESYKKQAEYTILENI